jgi:hypothetical protein
MAYGCAESLRAGWRIGFAADPESRRTPGIRWRLLDARASRLRQVVGPVRRDGAVVAPGSRERPDVVVLTDPQHAIEIEFIDWGP